MRRILGTIAISAALLLGFGATPANAATSGNVVCNSGASTETLRVDYANGGYVNLGAGRCSTSGAQAFRVRVGEHCISPWGTAYNGPAGWWLGLESYRYPISGNYQRLTYRCLDS